MSECAFPVLLKPLMCVAPVTLSDRPETLGEVINSIIAASDSSLERAFFCTCADFSTALEVLGHLQRRYVSRPRSRFVRRSTECGMQLHGIDVGRAH